MHKRMTGALSVLFAGAMVGAVALGGCSSMNLPNASKYEPASIEVEGWKASIAGANVVFNSSTQTDDLVVYVDVTNNTNEESMPQAHLLVSATQGGTTLVGSSLAQETQDNDEQKAATTSDEAQDQAGEVTSMGTSSNFAKTLKPKETTRAIFSYDLYNTSDVDVIVEPISASDGDTSSSSDSSKAQKVTFKVDGLQTAESKKVAVDYQQKLQSNSVQIAGAKADVADGYHIESVDDTSCDIVKNEGSPHPIIRLTNETNHGDAQTWANSFRNTYPNASEMDTVNINGVNYLRFFPVPDQFQLYADCPSGGVLQVFGMFTSYDAAMDQLSKISVV